MRRHPIENSQTVQKLRDNNPSVYLRFSHPESFGTARVPSRNLTGLEQAKKALENVNGHELKVIPAGYQVNHIGYAEPGQTNDITFAAPLAAGDYAIVCFIPRGGMDDHGNPKDPKAIPHVKLGMISLLHVV